MRYKGPYPSQKIVSKFNFHDDKKRVKKKVLLPSQVRSYSPPQSFQCARQGNFYVSLKGDGTYDTISKLVFIATRFENEQTLGCEASNEIMVERKEEPMREILTLEVL
ncbi:unnamed protein product [Nezara viridula]|uniref:Uncharacterized protein n=1 Tax=Nezara viridula TaxID=85310 RepID=A0A9P0H5Y5_NEZVI|nr:unnamed protein product [Nezara viridula]